MLSHCVFNPTTIDYNYEFLPIDNSLLIRILSYVTPPFPPATELMRVHLSEGFLQFQDEQSTV